MGSQLQQLSSSVNKKQQQQHNLLQQPGPSDTDSHGSVSSEESTSMFHPDDDKKEEYTRDSRTATTTKQQHVSMSMNHLLPYCGALVWPLMLTVPLVLSSSFSPWHYSKVFPASWYEYDQSTMTPKPLGLCLGIFAVAVGQVAVWIFFYLFKFGYLSSSTVTSSSSKSSQSPVSIQIKGAREYDFWEGLQTHVSQPEGFVLLVGYLSVTWMCHLMPVSYYTFDGSIQWHLLALCLVIQDGIQYTMHVLEHVASPLFYQYSHKPHHRFTNPRLFDAFNGSFLDTLCMITIPLFLTANIMRSVNVWTYMAFGSSYAGWLTLIHSEYTFIWDPLFRRLGLGTPADHHVHHKFFKFNYGHLFMWFDQVCGTYRDPKHFAPKVFSEGV